MLPGTHLVAYGHGDWNDSLQPADPAMAETLTSSWTVTLHHEALRAVADGLDGAGADPDLAGALRDEAMAVAADLQRHLVVDGELAGYAQLDVPDRSVTAVETPADVTEPAAGGPEVTRLLVHPRDDETGLRHGSLQMIHALGADLLSPDQAERHVALVREHLMGADGVRLFDTPPAYRGGRMRHFQRAETATFVGREIGLMYVHAHLRWCEALARWGDADGLWQGLQQVLAPATPSVVPGARLRQSNTYASSSDAAVRDRVDFAERYAQVLTGEVGFEAGWRIYSSGPGVLVRIVSQSLLGVRRRGAFVEIDPVLPAHLDGLTATVPLDGRLLRLRYHVGPRGCGTERVVVAGQDVSGERLANPYRTGGLRVPLEALGLGASDDAGRAPVEVFLP
jgi:CRISPR-associated protein Csx3